MDLTVFILCDMSNVQHVSNYEQPKQNDSKGIHARLKVGMGNSLWAVILCHLL